MTNISDNNDRILYPLTHPQKRIWYIEKIYPGTSLYNIGGPIRIKGSVDFSILEESINIFIKSNEGLRLRFVEENGEAKQFVSNYERVKLDFIDFSKCENPEDEFNKWVEKEARKPFAIKNERLFYFALFRISDNDNGYFVKFHHIISDGWSVNIMTEQICGNYKKLLKGEEINDITGPSYIEYISNEKKYLLSDRFLKNKLFWNEKFKVLPDTFFSRSSHVLEGKRKTYELDPDLSYRIKKFALDNKCSLNTFFTTLYLIYLYKTTLQEDIVIGTPVLNRAGKREKSIFGMFTSTMPFRFVIDDNINVTDTMVKVNVQLMECYFNQKYPYDLLVKDLNLNKKGCDNLFNTCVNYYNTRLNTELNGFTIENVEFYNGNQLYSMQLVIKDWSDSGNLTLDFDYKVNEYSDEQIEDMYIRLINLAGYIIMNPYEKLRNISLLSRAERKKLLYDFNATETEYPKHKTIYELFEEQAYKTPDRVAVWSSNIELTYRQLNQKANQLARYLIKKGLEKESIVSLLTTHSLETVIGILGILKAGAAYLPIDPGYPYERIRYMLEDSGSRTLLTNMEFPENINFDSEIINLNNQELFSENDSHNIGCVNRQNDLAYTIYTSGSTGRPKGVMIEHQALVNYIWWARKMYVKNGDEVFPLYSSLAFDLTVTSIFTPLISGCKIVVYSQDSDDEYVLYKIMKENRATVIKLTPSHLSLLKDRDNRNSQVRRIIVGGEDLKVSLAKAIHESFGGNVEIYNEYGATETTVGCMVHKYDYNNDTKTSVPIGIPADNVQVYILDKNLEPVPPGAVGEIYISGHGVARGYLNRLELTSEKFIENPFISGKRMYKTGDLARSSSNGKIEYVGRADQQVKIRGYRIEPGEIEKYLLEHGSVKDAVVIDAEGRNGAKYLCAYFVKRSNITPGELRNYLTGFLPEYMIPAYFIELDYIPLTSNGKVDRQQLPQAEMPEITRDLNSSVENENELFDVVSEVLNIDRIDAWDNFYHIGGDSIKAIQISSKMNERGLRIRVKDILSHPVMKDMALYVEKPKDMEECKAYCEGSIRFIPVVSWFFSQNYEFPHHYNQSVLLKLKKDTDTKTLEIVLIELIKHHDSLRLNYNPETSELFYNNRNLDKQIKIDEYDLSGYSYAEQCARLMETGEEIKSGFNIEKDILIKACIFNLGPQGKRLLITAHHLVVDIVSWKIILSDICTLLKQINCHRKMNLPSKTHSLQKWLKALESYGDRFVNKEKEYWQDVLNHDSNLPADYDQGEDTIGQSQTLKKTISQDITRKLLYQANSVYNTEPKDILIAAFLLTIKNKWGKKEIVIELEGHGRNDIFDDVDISRTVGWFTNIYPVYFKIQDSDFPDLLKEVKECLRRVPSGGLGFGVLKYLRAVLEDSSRKYIRFNFLGNFGEEFDNEFFSLAAEESGSEISRYNHMSSLLDINCFVFDEKLNIFVTYSRNKLSEKTMENFMNMYEDNIRSLVVHCCNKQTVEFTPSDFDSVVLSQDELDNLFR